MKYYRVTLPSGLFYYAANKADAACAENATSEPVEIPTDRVGLLDWLNEHGTALPPAVAADRCPNCKRTFPEAARIAGLANRAAILAACEDQIFAADANTLAALAGFVIIRLQELRGGALQ